MDEPGAEPAPMDEAPAPNRTYSDAEMIAALEANYGIVSRAAKAIGCNEATIRGRAKKSAKLRKAIIAHRADLVDLAETGLAHHLEKKEPWAIRFALERLGRDRGWGEKPAAETPDLSPLAGIRKAIEASLRAAEREA